MTLNERTTDMLARYGEAVKVSTAAHIIDRDRTTINRMLADGRLDAVCGGTQVDVRSLARYICQPAVENRLARMRKQGNPAAKWCV